MLGTVLIIGLPRTGYVRAVKYAIVVLILV